MYTLAGAYATWPTSLFSLPPAALLIITVPSLVIAIMRICRYVLRLAYPSAAADYVYRGRRH